MWIFYFWIQQVSYESRKCVFIEKCLVIGIDDTHILLEKLKGLNHN